MTKGDAIVVGAVLGAVHSTAGGTSLRPLRRAYISWVDRNGNGQIEYYTTREIAEKVATWRRKGPRKWDHKYPPKLIGEHRAVFNTNIL